MRRYTSSETVLVFSVIGLAGSLFMLLAHIMGKPIPCAVTTPAVKQASLFLGLPVALWGVGMFAALFGLASWSMRLAQLMAVALSFTGTAFAVHLAQISSDMSVFCPFCVGAWVWTAMTTVTTVFWLVCSKPLESAANAEAPTATAEAEPQTHTA